MRLYRAVQRFRLQAQNFSPELGAASAVQVALTVASILGCYTYSVSSTAEPTTQLPVKVVLFVPADGLAVGVRMSWALQTELVCALDA